MEVNPDHPRDGFETENAGGSPSGFLAEEDEIDRRSLWRLGSWGVGAVVAVLLAVLASQSAFRLNLDQVASDDLARQAQQLRTAARESQNEARRLASAVEKLSSDRDRLYARVAVLEQGLDSMTGSIARQNAATATPAGPRSTPAAAPVIAPVDTTVATVASAGPAGSGTPAASPATPLIASSSITAPPDAAAAKLSEPEAPAPEAVGSIPPATDAKPGVPRTEFAVDLGTATSLTGLRTLWRGLIKSNAALAALHPVVAMKDGNRGPGVRLRLVAGPLSDAAAAAKICAALKQGRKTCETTMFDGQHLAMQVDEPRAAVIKPARTKRSPPAASGLFRFAPAPATRQRL
jgi:hypothetical protein